MNAQTLHLGYGNELTFRHGWVHQAHVERFCDDSEERVNEIRRGSSPIGALLVQMTTMDKANHTDRRNYPSRLLSYFTPESLFDSLLLFATTSDAQYWNRRV